MENLISKEYVKKLKQLHETKPSFGSKSYVPELLKKYLGSNNIKTALDYGCGKGNVMNEIKTIFSNQFCRVKPDEVGNRRRRICNECIRIDDDHCIKRIFNDRFEFFLVLL